MRLQGLDHVALYVRDVHVSARWYREVLGLERRHEEAWGDIPIVMCAGETGVALFPAHEGDAASSRAKRAPGIFAHVAFRIDGSGWQDARRVLRERGVPLEEQDHGIARSLYMRDLDGHAVEITTYDV